MKEMPYTKLPREQLIFRDILSVQRTVLANERNLLAFIRTALAFFIVGLSSIHFLESLAGTLAGGVFLVFSLVTLVVGIVRYRNVKMHYKDFMTFPLPERKISRGSRSS